MLLVHWLILSCGVAFLAWAVTQWKRRPTSHPEYVVRRDVAMLGVLLVAGTLGDAIRTRFIEGSAAFIAASAALVPIAIAALVVLVRICHAYRRGGDVDVSTPRNLRNRRG